MFVELQNLSPEKFKDFGDIIGRNELSDEDFQVVISEPTPEGWRIAINKISRGEITTLGLHPNTRETFEPLSGICVLVVARQLSPQKMEAFLLDKPICLNKNIWHATVSLSESSYIKIVENSIVRKKEISLTYPLDIGVIQTS